jgi:hypothetical protein
VSDDVSHTHSVPRASASQEQGIIHSHKKEGREEKDQLKTGMRHKHGRHAHHDPPLITHGHGTHAHQGHDTVAQAQRMRPGTVKQ